MTAVEWLVEQLQQNKFITESQIHLAKEMEKEQEQEQDEFAIGFAEWCLRIKFEPIENVSVKKLLEIYKK